MSTTYSASWYEKISAGCRSSAAAVAPLVQPPPETVLDVGCGQGWWGREFEDRGATVFGIDGDYVKGPVIDFQAMDLSQPFFLDSRFDLVVCLEVAEHLPPRRAESLVSNLCAHAPRVLFSAAMPRQGGQGHVNCQPPAYWAGLFREQGFGWDDSIRRALWQDETVEPWYLSNMLMFTRGEGEMERDPDWLIHPRLWLLPK